MQQQNYMAQMKEHNKTLGKIQLSNEERANLSHAQFKTLVIRMLTELIELGCKIKDQTKANQSEIKQNTQRTNSEGKETGIQINYLEQKEDQNRMKKQEFKKMRRDLGTSRTTLNVPTSES